MKPSRVLIAAAIQIALLAQEGAVSFDLAHCGSSFSLESGLAVLVNSYIAGTHWGLLRSWLRHGQEWTGGLTALGPLQ